MWMYIFLPIGGQNWTPIGGQFSTPIDKRGLFCPDHPQQQATGRFIVQFGRQVRRRCSSLDEAERLLTGIRYEVDKNTFDVRDYQSGNPLGFRTLSEKWLLMKASTVKPGSYRNLKRYIHDAISAWGDRNIKQIGFAEIEDFLNSHSVSNKTKANYRSCLHSFWSWLLHRKVITLAQFPDFPEIKYHLGYRKIISKETQELIIEEVRRISYHVNPKIWLGIKWLATYIAVRPGELVMLKHKNIDTALGIFIVRHTKEGKEKFVPMLDEDIELVKSLPASFPDMPFFRHEKGWGGVTPGSRFSKHYWYTWWKTACENLGIEGVDLYGGTRHSSATALKKFLSPEQIKAGTMHSTNKAFERYFQRNSKDALAVFHLSRGGTQVKHISDASKKIMY